MPWVYYIIIIITRKKSFNASKEPIHPKFRGRQTISIDARVANFSTKFMWRSSDLSIALPILRTRHTINKLLRGMTKIILVKDREWGDITAQVQWWQLRDELRCIDQVICSPAGNSLQIIVQRRDSINPRLESSADRRGNIVEEFKVESSAYKCIELDVMERRSLMNIRNNVEDKT